MKDQKPNETKKTTLIIELVFFINFALVVSLLFYAMQPYAAEQKQKELEMFKESLINVTVVETSEMKLALRSGGGVFSNEKTSVESLPYIIAETDRGEVISGVIDITTLSKGDKIVIQIRETRRKDEYTWIRRDGYIVLKFICYQ